MPCRLTLVCVSFVSLLALSLRPTIAQTNPKRVTTAKELVAIKADFVLLRSLDLDGSSVNFDRLPVTERDSPVPPAAQNQLYLRYATGYPVRLLYQTLTQAPTPAMSLTTKIFSAPAVRTPSNSPVTVSIDEAVPDFSEPTLTSSSPFFLPRVKRLLQMQASLTLTPYVNAHHSITLGLSLPPDLTTPSIAPGQPFLLPPVTSGGTLVISGLYAPGNEGVTLSSAVLLNNRNMVLIFITPTIISENKVGVP